MEGISIVSTNLNEGDDFLRKQINALMQTYKLELKALSKILGVDYTCLKDFMDRKNNLHDIYVSSMNLKETYNDSFNRSNPPTLSHLSSMISMLSEGVLMINEDDRVKGVIYVLVSEYEISYETLAIYSKLDLEDLQSFMKDTNSISYEKKYKLAVASLFLNYLFKK